MTTMRKIYGRAADVEVSSEADGEGGGIDLTRLAQRKPSDKCSIPMRRYGLRKRSTF